MEDIEFWQACKNNNLEKVKEGIEQGCNISFQVSGIDVLFTYLFSLNFSCLHIAIKNNHLDVVDLLIKYKPEALKEKINGSTMDEFIKSEEMKQLILRQ
ncbi:hypothetical protein ABK040_001809 [Willaertia magna]